MNGTELSFLLYFKGYDENDIACCAFFFVYGLLKFNFFVSMARLFDVVNDPLDEANFLAILPCLGRVSAKEIRSD